MPTLRVGENVPLVTSPTAAPSAGDTDMCGRGMRALEGLEPPQRPARAGLLLREQRVPAPEGVLLPAHGPAGARLHRRDVHRQVLPVQRVAHLGAQRVAGAQPARPDAEGSPASSTASQSAAVVPRRHQLVAALAGVAGPAHHDLGARRQSTASKDM